MSRFLTLLLCTAALLVSVGCDNAKKFASDVKKEYQELETIARDIGQIATAVKASDYVGAGKYCRQLEPFLNAKVLLWTVQVLAIEEKDGVEAAKAAIERYRSTEGLTADERAALDKLQGYYRDKTGRTGDLIVVVAAIAVEEKFKHHGAGGTFLQICQKLRTHPDTNTVTAVKPSSAH
jgi:hypothetical protein